MQNMFKELTLLAAALFVGYMVVSIAWAAGLRAGEMLLVVIATVAVVSYAFVKLLKQWGNHG